MKKSRIRKLMEDPNEREYKPTKKAIQYWFRVLNEEVFDNKLHPIGDIEIRPRRKIYAEYECETDDETVNSRISMNDKFRSKQMFINILFHEMVHHHQAIYREPLGHGPSFFSWKDHAAKFGLTLYTKYD